MFFHLRLTNSTNRPLKLHGRQLVEHIEFIEVSTFEEGAEILGDLLKNAHSPVSEIQAFLQELTDRPFQPSFLYIRESITVDWCFKAGLDMEE